MSERKINSELKDTIDYFFKKLFFYLFCKLACWIICIYFLIACIGKAQAQNPLHEKFKDEFTGTATQFAYMEDGKLKRENCVRIMGTLKPLENSFSLSKIRLDSSRLRTACEAAQHVWMVFNLQQRAQAELKAETELFKKEQKRKRIKCMLDDPKCSLYSFFINAKIYYWIQFNPQEWMTREDYIEHFRVGVNGLDDILAWRDWVKQQRINLERKR